MTLGGGRMGTLSFLQKAAKKLRDYPPGQLVMTKLVAVVAQTALATGISRAIEASAAATPAVDSGTSRLEYVL